MAAGLALVEAFNEWHWANNCFHDHVTQFALQNQANLTAAPGGEHSHLAHDLHRQFRDQLEGFVQGFLDHHGTTMEAFAAALYEHKNSEDLCTRASIEVVTDEVFALLEYDAFHKTMLRALAEESRPDAQAVMQAMANADIPGARAIVQAVAEEQADAQGSFKELYGDSALPASGPSQQRLQVALPDGVQAGEQLNVTAPDGQTLCVVVPVGIAPGQLFEVTYAPIS